MRLLVVGPPQLEDEATSQELTRHGHTLCHVSSCDRAVRELNTSQTDLVLLSSDIEDRDSLDVCRELRQQSSVPIITLVVCGGETERVLSLHAGSDDCLAHPFGFRELIARIEAVTRRLRRQTSAPGAVQRGGLKIDPATREAWLSGRVLTLTRKEFDVLLLLAMKAGTVVPRQHLLRHVWGEEWAELDSYSSSRTVDTHMSSLRSKLGSPEAIVTVRGVGFRLGSVP